MKSRNLTYKVRIKDIPKDERPRERLIKHGPSSLSNAELLSIIMGTGNKKENALLLSTRLLTNYTLRELSEITIGELKGISGIKNAKACRILAAVEIGKRIVSHKDSKRSINSPEDIADMLMPEMRRLRKECLKGIHLDSKCGIIKEEVLSIGGLSTNTIFPREVFRTSIIHSAAAIILVHNHPSGDPEPSEEDIEFTRRIAEAGRLIGIELLDHIIIGDGRYVSMKERGII